MNAVNWYRYDEANHLVIHVHIQTGAKQTAADGLHGNALKIRLAAMPVNGKANALLVKFLAQQFAVPISRIDIKRGDKSRDKVIVIHQTDLDPQRLLDDDRISSV